MECMLLAESAILVHLQPVGVVFLFLHRVVVALLALGAGKCDLDSHDRHLQFLIGLPLKIRAQKKNPLRGK